MILFSDQCSSGASLLKCLLFVFEGFFLHIVPNLYNSGHFNVSHTKVWDVVHGCFPVTNACSHMARWLIGAHTQRERNKDIRYREWEQTSHVSVIWIVFIPRLIPTQIFRYNKRSFSNATRKTLVYQPQNLRLCKETPGTSAPETHSVVRVHTPDEQGERFYSKGPSLAMLNAPPQILFILLHKHFPSSAANKRDDNNN